MAKNREQQFANSDASRAIEHAVVDNFIKYGGIELHKVTEPRPASIEALLAVDEARSKAKSDRIRAFRKAMEIRIEELDPQFFILFASRCVQCNIEFESLAEAKLLLDRANVAFTPDMPLELRFPIMLAMSNLACKQGDYITGVT